MARTLPALERAAFAKALRDRISPHLSECAEKRLYAHYRTLQKWNRRLSLIGPGTVDEVIQRHYVESLAGSDWIDDGETVLDIGSGAGFPALIIALARPEIQVILVESRERKCNFLHAAIRAARDQSIACHTEPTRPFSTQVLNARIGLPLPGEIPARIDVITSRAVRLDRDLLEPLIEHDRTSRFLLWHGEGVELPMPLRERKRRKLVGGERRHLIEAVASDDRATGREGDQPSQHAV